MMEHRQVHRMQQRQRQLKTTHHRLFRFLLKPVSYFSFIEYLLIPCFQVHHSSRNTAVFETRRRFQQQLIRDQRSGLNFDFLTSKHMGMAALVGYVFLKSQTSKSQIFDSISPFSFQVYVCRTESGERLAIKRVLQDNRYKNRELQIMRRLDHQVCLQNFKIQCILIVFRMSSNSTTSSSIVRNHAKNFI